MIYCIHCIYSNRRTKTILESDNIELLALNTILKRRVHVLHAGPTCCQNNMKERYMTIIWDSEGWEWKEPLLESQCWSSTAEKPLFLRWKPNYRLYWQFSFCLLVRIGPHHKMFANSRNLWGPLNLVNIRYCELFDYVWQQATRNYNFMITNIQHASNNVELITEKRFNLPLLDVTQQKQLPFLKFTPE